jgi:hypothetical protein
MISIKFLKELRGRWETSKNLTLQEGVCKEDFNFVLQLNARFSSKCCLCHFDN